MNQCGVCCAVQRQPELPDGLSSDQAAVRVGAVTRKFEYESRKLTCESEAKDNYEYWTKGAQLPKINGTTVNLNPAKT